MQRTNNKHNHKILI